MHTFDSFVKNFVGGPFQVISRHLRPGYVFHILRNEVPLSVLMCPVGKTLAIEPSKGFQALNSFPRGRRVQTTGRKIIETFLDQIL